MTPQWSSAIDETERLIAELRALIGIAAPFAEAGISVQVPATLMLKILKGQESMLQQVLLVSARSSAVKGPAVSTPAGVSYPPWAADAKPIGGPFSGG